MALRGAEHVRDLESQKSSNALVNYANSEHKNDKKKVTFQFEITKKFHDPLSRLYKCRHLQVQILIGLG